MLGTSDIWSMSRSSHWLSNPEYYIEDCWISTEGKNREQIWSLPFGQPFMTRPFDNGSRQRHHFPEDNFQSCFSVFVLCNHYDMGLNSVWSRIACCIIGKIESWFESEMLVISTAKHKLESIKEIYAVRLQYSFVYEITKVRWNEKFSPKLSKKESSKVECDFIKDLSPLCTLPTLEHLLHWYP